MHFTADVIRRWTHGAVKKRFVPGSELHHDAYPSPEYFYPTSEQTIDILAPLYGPRHDQKVGDVRLSGAKQGVSTRTDASILTPVICRRT